MYTIKELKRLLNYFDIDFQVIDNKIFVNDSNITYYSKQEIRELIYN